MRIDDAEQVMPWASLIKRYFHLLEKVSEEGIGFLVFGGSFVEEAEYIWLKDLLLKAFSNKDVELK